MYNKYIGNTGRYIRVEDQTQPKRPFPLPAQGAAAARPGQPPHPPPTLSGPRSFSPPAPGAGQKGFLGILPFGLDAGDIMLFLLLLFFYLESKDEEFLIILALVALSVFKER